MKRVLVTLAILALFPLLAGCGLLGFRNWEWRQKLVLEVETPNGTVTGSSVVRVDVRYEPQIIAHQGGFYKSVKGEAAFLEVRPGAYLFALLSVEAVRAEGTFLPEVKTKKPKDAFAYLEDFTGSALLPRKLYPRLVTFADITDPSTVTRVDPDDLAASFGPGYRLKSVTLEITNEPMTEGEVEKVLPPEFFQRWASIQRDALDQGGIKNPHFKTFASDLNRGDFIRR